MRRCCKRSKYAFLLFKNKNFYLILIIKDQKILMDAQFQSINSCQLIACYQNGVIGPSVRQVNAVKKENQLDHVKLKFIQTMEAKNVHLNLMIHVYATRNAIVSALFYTILYIIFQILYKKLNSRNTTGLYCWSMGYVE